MVDTAARRKDITQTELRRCPACGQPLRRLVDGRCELCRFQVEEAPITSEDTTPYALSEGYGFAAWRRMCWWVYGASNERLSHLSLMRLSLSSQRFARGGLLLLAVAAFFWQFGQAGWYRAMAEGAGQGRWGAPPRGPGWFQLVTTPAPPLDDRNPSRAAALWWNPAEAAIAAVSTTLVALLLGWLWLRWVDRGAQKTLKPAHRHQGRLSCALRYGTAWVVPGAVCVMLLVAVPLWSVAEVRDWGWMPPSVSLFGPVLIIVAACLLIWWIWLMRLSLSVPVSSRTRVLMWFMVAAPLLGAILMGGAVVGLPLGYEALFSLFGWDG